MNVIANWPSVGLRRRTVVPVATCVAFGRLVARPIDRIHIAASQIPTRDELHALSGFEVSPGDAALVATFLPREGMTLADLRLPLRYVPEDRIRQRLAEGVDKGVITFDGDFIAYTAAGLIAAQAVLDTHAIEVERMWSNTAGVVSDLLALAQPIADAATTANRPSGRLIDDALSALYPTNASDLWRAVAKIRRYRADCHAEAWREAGYTATSIKALPADAVERKPIEDRTDEFNADIWSHLPDHDQLRFMAGLAALDGSGTPT